jgi:hypothetical protein
LETNQFPEKKVIGRSAAEDKQIPTVIELTAQIIPSNVSLTIRQLRNNETEYIRN